MTDYSDTTTAAVIVAAGRGIRFNNRHKKQFSRVAGHPVIAWTVSAFDRAQSIDSLVLAVPSEDIRRIREEILSRYRISKNVLLVAGGEKRQDSVYRCLLALSPEIRYAAIHDGVRPAVEPETIDAVCRSAYEHGAALLAERTTDSVFEAAQGTVLRYFDRERLWQAQTPQAFLREGILMAHKRALEEGFDASDDGVLYRKYTGVVHVIEGPSDNIKITLPGDAYALEKILKDRETPRL